MPTPTDEALAELNDRFAERGFHARVYVHDGMMSAMTHRDGDAEATVDARVQTPRSRLPESMPPSVLTS
ncbi:hypothetical protein [Candidatus Poriferisodalis sp.]|uniref:hypothetical protein n=1 Tax=Candidatus Poriferisodalis sp. TaxID=3101277 RepID=UPI003B02923E